jgi:hypothetical protein
LRFSFAFTSGPRDVAVIGVRYVIRIEIGDVDEQGVWIASQAF